MFSRSCFLLIFINIRLFSLEVVYDGNFVNENEGILITLDTETERKHIYNFNFLDNIWDFCDLSLSYSITSAVIIDDAVYFTDDYGIYSIGVKSLKGGNAKLLKKGKFQIYGNKNGFLCVEFEDKKIQDAFIKYSKVEKIHYLNYNFLEKSSIQDVFVDDELNFYILLSSNTDLAVMNSVFLFKNDKQWVVKPFPELKPNHIISSLGNIFITSDFMGDSYCSEINSESWMSYDVPIPYCFPIFSSPNNSQYVYNVTNKKYYFRSSSQEWKEAEETSFIFEIKKNAPISVYLEFIFESKANLFSSN